MTTEKSVCQILVSVCDSDQKVL